MSGAGQTRVCFHCLVVPLQGKSGDLLPPIKCLDAGKKNLEPVNFNKFQTFDEYHDLIMLAVTNFILCCHLH